MDNILKYCVVIRMAAHLTGLKLAFALGDEIPFPGAGR
jgi:hypothetical protein